MKEKMLESVDKWEKTNKTTFQDYLLEKFIAEMQKDKPNAQLAKVLLDNISKLLDFDGGSGGEQLAAVVTRYSEEAN